MPLKVVNIERENELLGIRFKSHFGDVFNIMIDFKQRLVWYKDGFSFSGKWTEVDTSVLIEKKGGEKNACDKVKAKVPRARGTVLPEACPRSIGNGTGQLLSGSG